MLSTGRFCIQPRTALLHQCHAAPKPLPTLPLPFRSMATRASRASNRQSTWWAASRASRMRARRWS